MRTLPLTEQSAMIWEGGACYQKPPANGFEKAILLQAVGDGVTVRASGRQVGIVFLRHERGGMVEVLIADQQHRLDLFSATPLQWVFEAALPLPGQDVAITVRMTDEQNDSSLGTEVWILAVYTSEYLTSEIPDLIRLRVEAHPFEQATLNQLTDVFKWYDAEWLAALNALACSPPYTPPDFVHRKSWEWTQCIFGLDYLGMFQPEYNALGVGVGWEPLSFFFSNHLREVVATDLYPEEGQWSEGGAQEGNPDILENPDKFAPIAYRRDRLSFRRMDGKKLDFPDASFDIVWSCSSIEHFGGPEGAAQSMREIERVLKPGGVAAIITEYVLPDPTTGAPALFDPEYFNIRYLYEYLVRPVGHLRLVQNVDLSIPDYYVRRACKLPEEAGAPHSGSDKPHIVLRSPSGALHTSIALFFRKEGGAPVRSARRRFTTSQPQPRAPLAPAKPPSLASMEHQVSVIQQLPFPLFYSNGTGIKALGRRALNRAIRLVGKSQIMFGAAARKSFAELAAAVRQQNQVLENHAIVLKWLSQQIPALQNDSSTISETEIGLSEQENDQL